MKNGKFVISLDFELHWGAVEKWNLEKKKYFDTTRESVPLVLSLFEKYGIHATWATVGLLFAIDKEQLLELLPNERPAYKNESLNYFNLIETNQIGNDEIVDPYHYGYSLINNILKTPNQELGTHTFCHYYCNEPGQNLQQFEADLKAAQRISIANFGIELESLVFPRNQFNESYLDVARENGIKVVRSNPDVWFWNSKSIISPMARGFDTLMPISSSLTFDEDNLIKKKNIVLLPASRFLRPYSIKEKQIQSLKLNRVLREMTYAAKNNEVYHLWWHPHNFGYFPDGNLSYLEKILTHYKKLNAEYSFTSQSMIELV